MSPRGMSSDILLPPQAPNLWLRQYRYNELTLILRIWVYLRQVRCGGGSHISGGFGALAPGSLAVECPACPHPGKNLVSPQVDR